MEGAHPGSHSPAPSPSLGRASKLGRRAEAALLAALFAAGALHWLYFLGFPKELPRHVGDWPKELRYYSVLRQSVTEGRVPYFVSMPIQQTRKFLSIPEVTWSPQVLLLRVLSADSFVAVNTALLYAAGFAGCLLIRRRYRLSLFPFAFLFLLFNFNGHITAHLAVGHSMWAGYFLLPFFFLYLLEMIDGDAPAAPLKLALALFAVLLQGAVHIFTWCVLFLILVAAFRPRHIRAVIAALAWAAALSACRLVPSAVVLLSRRTQVFLSGYPTLTDLLASLTVVRGPDLDKRGGITGGLNWWEYDAYVGLGGLAFLVGCGIYLRLKGSAVREALRYRNLNGPMAVMALLSVSYFYYILTLLPLPLLASERVSSRMLIIPLALLVVLGGIAMESCRGELARRRWLRWGVVLAAVETAFSLAKHSHAWRISALERAWPPPPHARDMSIEIVRGTGLVETWKDALYLTSVKTAAALSLLALAALAWRLWRARGGAATSTASG